MARVTDQEVKEIFNATEDLTPFIIAANTLVTNRLVGQGLSDDELKEIERWLAAHFATCRFQMVSQRKVGDAAVTFHGKSDMGLDASPYGQQVKLLDTSGKLASLGKIPATVETIRRP